MATPRVVASVVTALAAAALASGGVGPEEELAEPFYCASLPLGLAALLRRGGAEAPDALHDVAASTGGAGPGTGEEALDPLDELWRRCYRARTGYWTYELCPFRTIRQYHAADRRRSAVVHVLGHHARDRDEVEPARQALVHHYAGGDGGRTARVRFVCPGAQSGNDLDSSAMAAAAAAGGLLHGEALAHVAEPTPLRYEFTFTSAAVCESVLRAGPGVALLGQGRGGGGGTGSPASTGEGGLPGLATGRRQAADGVGADVDAEVDASASATGSRSDAAKARPPLQPPAPRATVARAEDGATMGARLPGARLLQPLKGRCFQRSHAYWTYELCPGKHLRQFRQEGQRVGAAILLGVYAPDEEVVTVTSAPTRPVASPGFTFTQRYVNGSSSREATVLVACSRGKNEHSLQRVDEGVPMRYSALFTTPLACDVNCVRTRPAPLAVPTRPRVLAGPTLAAP